MKRVPPHNDVGLSEGPLGRLGSGLMDKAKAAVGDSEAQGRSETGAVARKVRAQWKQFKGRMGSEEHAATGENMAAFFANQYGGAVKQVVSAVLSGQQPHYGPVANDQQANDNDSVAQGGGSQGGGSQGGGSQGGGPQGGGSQGGWGGQESGAGRSNGGGRPQGGFGAQDDDAAPQASGGTPRRPDGGAPAAATATKPAPAASAAAPATAAGAPEPAPEDEAATRAAKVMGDAATAATGGVPANEKTINDQIVGALAQPDSPDKMRNLDRMFDRREMLADNGSPGAQARYAAFLQRFMQALPDGGRQTEYEFKLKSAQAAAAKETPATSDASTRQAWTKPGITDPKDAENAHAAAAQAAQGPGVDAKQAWAKPGIAPSDAKPWAKPGIAPSDAKPWAKPGIAQSDAKPWAKPGIAQSDAKPWAKPGASEVGSATSADGAQATTAPASADASQGTARPGWSTPTAMTAPAASASPQAASRPAWGTRTAMGAPPAPGAAQQDARPAWATPATTAGNARQNPPAVGTRGVVPGYGAGRQAPQPVGRTAASQSGQDARAEPMPLSRTAAPHPGPGSRVQPAPLSRTAAPAPYPDGRREPGTGPAPAAAPNAPRPPASRFQRNQAPAPGRTEPQAPGRSTVPGGGRREPTFTRAAESAAIPMDKVMRAVREVLAASSFRDGARTPGAVLEATRGSPTMAAKFFPALHAIPQGQRRRVVALAERLIENAIRTPEGVSKAYRDLFLAERTPASIAGFAPTPATSGDAPAGSGNDLDDAMQDKLINAVARQLLASGRASIQKNGVLGRSTVTIAEPGQQAVASPASRTNAAPGRGQAQEQGRDNAVRRQGQDGQQAVTGGYVQKMVQAFDNAHDHFNGRDRRDMEDLKQALARCATREQVVDMVRTSSAGFSSNAGAFVLGMALGAGGGRPAAAFEATLKKAATDNAFFQGGDIAAVREVLKAGPDWAAIRNMGAGRLPCSNKTGALLMGMAYSAG